MTWWVVVNPAAGRSTDIAGAVAGVLRERGIPFELRTSQSGDDVAEVVAAGLGAGHRRFVAVGGDGTVNLVVNALLRADLGEPPTLGVLPAGSGCDLVRTFAIPQDLAGAADHLVGDDVYPIDVGHLQGAWGDRFFVNTAEAGLPAAIIDLATRLPDWTGSRRYHLATWPALLRFPKAEIRLVTEQRVYEGPAMMVVIANGQFFGGGMNVAPRASLVDGMADVQVFSGPKRNAVVLHPRITRGTHLQHRSVRRFEAAEFRLEANPQWMTGADGELLGAGPVEGRMIKGAIALKI